MSLYRHTFVTTGRLAYLGRWVALWCLWASVLAWAPAQAWGQGVAGEGLEVRWLRQVYAYDAAGFSRAMRGVDATAYPLFGGSIAVAWGVAGLQEGGDYRVPYQMTLSAGVTVAMVLALKAVVRRPRPYRVVPGITSRSAGYGEDKGGTDQYAWPSGHAALAATLATTWSLAHPRWYVVAPAAVWASAVALSRVWLGVHYPGDVLAGLLLGSGIAVLINHLTGARAPTFLGGNREQPVSLPVVRIRLP